VCVCACVCVWLGSLSFPLYLHILTCVCVRLGVVRFFFQVLEKFVWQSCPRQTLSQRPKKNKTAFQGPKLILYPEFFPLLFFSVLINEPCVFIAQTGIKLLSIESVAPSLCVQLKRFESLRGPGVCVCV
jgi:hypothetical protein